MTSGPNERFSARSNVRSNDGINFSRVLRVSVYNAHSKQAHFAVHISLEISAHVTPNGSLRIGEFLGYLPVCLLFSCDHAFGHRDSI